MKLNRLLEITLILLNKGTVTAKELAERFGVSTRLRWWGLWCR